MESHHSRQIIAFGSLQSRLITRLKTRIHNGEFSERGLARVLAVSQTHIHNVLKGARKLPLELADRILKKLGMSVVHLIDDAELKEEVALRRLPFPGWPETTVGSQPSPNTGSRKPPSRTHYRGEQQPVELRKNPKSSGTVT